MESYKFKRITSADASTTVVVCATACLLAHITINTTSAHALTVKDAVSGGNGTATIASIAASPVIGSVFRYMVDCERGLTIDVPASYVGDITVAFKAL